MARSRIDLRGVEVLYTIAIKDGLAPLKHFTNSLPREVDWVFFSGGLGPTPDDTTRSDIATILNLKLVERPELFAHIERVLGAEKAQRFKKENKVQTYFPEGAQILDNPRGTAAGFLIEHGNQKLVFTPGVPFEMKHILQKEIFPKIQPKDGYYKREFRTYGLGESAQTRLFANIQIPPSITFASLPGKSDLLVRLSGNQGEKIFSMRCLK